VGLNQTRLTSIRINLLWKFAERMFSQFVSLLVSIVLARLLLPKDYGAISIVLVFIVVADVLVTCGFGNALIQKKEADNVDFSSVFFFNIGFSLLLYLLLFSFAPCVAHYYDLDILTPVFRVLGLRVIISGINSVQNAYVSRNMMFRRFFWSTFFGTIVSGIFGILMAYRGYGVWALVTQSMINSVVNTLVLWETVRWRPQLVFSITRIKVLISYGWKILFEGLSETIVVQLRNLIIGKVYSPGDLGYYTKAQQFPGLLVSNISVSMSSVLFPAMSLRQDDKEHILWLLRKAVILSSYVLFPMLAGLAIAAKPLISLLLTEKWLECVPYMQIFCFTQAATIGMISRHQALNATGRSDVFMYEHIFSRVVGLLILFYVYRISVMAIALSLVASSLIFIFVIMYTSKRFNHYSYKNQLSDIFPPIAICFCMGIPIYFIRLLELSNGLTLCMQIFVGTFIYIALSVISKPMGYRTRMEYIIPIFVKLRKTGY